jgi:two-component sensor histidine kinase
MNEELQTVNNELKCKLEAISRAHSDLQNLMAATDVGILFLDPALRIKRFTPRVKELFNIKESDEGRPITDFTHHLEYENFTDDVRTVLAHLAPIEREIHTRKGGWYQMCLQGSCSCSTAEFIEGFHGRLGALARAHERLIASNWQGAQLEALARDQLDPYMSENSVHMRIEGEPVTLPPRLATPLSLLLHELATNAVKHGSLKDPNGSVSLTWRLESENDRRVLTMMWQEQGERPVTVPEKSGFGMFLIKQGLPGAGIRHTFRHEGVVCTIDVPMSTVIES